MTKLIPSSVDFAFNHAIALKFGIPAAMVLNRIIWSINYHAEEPGKWRDRYFFDDLWWTDNTFDGIICHFRGLFSMSTIQRALRDLKNSGILIVKKKGSDRWDQTNWYAIEKEVYEKNLMIMHPVKSTGSSSGQNDQIGLVKMTDSSSSNSPTHNQLTSPPPSEDVHGAKGQDDCLDDIFDIGPNLKSDRPKDDLLSEDLSIAQKWLDFAIKAMPWKNPPKGWEVSNWAKAIAKMRKKTDINHDGVEAMLDFIRHDPFWQKNALSPVSILDKNDQGLSKFDHIWLKMKGGKQFRSQIINDAVDEALAEFK